MKLKINDVSYTTKDGIEVLKNINLSFEKKSFVVILGESGCGKTTLLKIIAGLIDPDNGSIEINDEDVTQFQTSSRDLTMVFQEFALYPHMTLYENVLTSLNGIDIDDNEKDRLVKTMLQSFGLLNYMNFKPRNLSEGQKQRVAICKALVREPELFLLDEPLANLDLPQRRAIRKELKNIFNECKSSFVYVTHDYQEAEYLADLVVVMHKGKILQFDTFDAIRNNPKTKKAAQLIYGGMLNEFVVEIVGKYARTADFSLENHCKTPVKSNILFIPYNSFLINENGKFSGQFITSKIVNNSQQIELALDSGKHIYLMGDLDNEYKEKDVIRFDISSKYFIY